jgi:hypothetical protein
MSSNTNDVLSAKSRKTFGAEKFVARKRLPNETPPRTLAPLKWEPMHPDLVAHVARPGANDHQHIKSRGIG